MLTFQCNELPGCPTMITAWIIHLSAQSKCMEMVFPVRQHGQLSLPSRNGNQNKNRHFNQTYTGTSSTAFEHQYVNQQGWRGGGVTSLRIA